MLEELIRLEIAGILFQPHLPGTDEPLNALVARTLGTRSSQSGAERRQPANQDAARNSQPTLEKTKIIQLIINY